MELVRSLNNREGWSAASSAPPLCKSPLIPSSQLETREGKIREQIGLLANLSREMVRKEAWTEE